MSPFPKLLPLFLCCVALGSAACREANRPEPGAALVHLAADLSRAMVVSAGPPPAARERRQWSFAGSRSGWRTLSSKQDAVLAAVELEQLDDGIRLGMPRAQDHGPFRMGGIQVDLGELRFDDWEVVIVRARTSDRFVGVAVAYNVEEEGSLPPFRRFFDSPDQAPPIFNDGSEQAYAVPLHPRKGSGAPSSLRSLAVIFAAPGPAEVDVLSVALVPRGAGFLEEFGAKQVSRDGTTRHTLFAHAPAKLTYPVDLSGVERFDFGLAVSRGESVTYRVSTEREGQRQVLFEETIDDPESWHQRSVELADGESTSADLILEAESEQEGAVALWGAPIVSGERSTDRPNVIFYVIDGGDANLMSLYEYGRPTTPFLEGLAEEGVLFTRAYSNAT